MSEATPPRVIAEFDDYQGFLVALRKRADEIQIVRGSDATAHLSGLPDGYVAKLLGPNPIRRLGMKSLGPMLGVLQAKLVLVVDEEAVKRYGSRVRKRDDRLVRSGTLQIEISHRELKRRQRKGGANSRANMTEEEATEMGRSAAIIRWDAVREAVKAKARRKKKAICDSATIAEAALAPQR